MPDADNELGLQPGTDPTLPVIEQPVSEPESKSAAAAMASALPGEGGRELSEEDKAQNRACMVDAFRKAGVDIEAVLALPAKVAELEQKLSHHGIVGPDVT